MNIIKKCIPLIILVLIGCDILSQSENRFKGGLNFGLTTSQIHGDGYAGFDKAGYTLGFFLENKLSEKGTFLMELNYVSKGSMDPPNPNIGKIQFKRIYLEYAEIPAIYKIHIKQFRVNLGLSLGVLTRERHRDRGGLIPQNQWTIGPLNRYEVAYLIGAEYHFNDQWSVAWRHSSSLLPVTTTNVQVERFNLGFFWGAYNQYMSLTLRRNFGN